MVGRSVGASQLNTNSSSIMANKELLNKSNITEAISILKQLDVKKSDGKKKKQILSEDGNRVFLQVGFHKIPILQFIKTLKFKIPYPWLDIKDSCLIVSDKNLMNFDNDQTIAYYKELLAEKGLEVGQIIPYRQLRSEYKQYEALRHLAEAFDVFLADGRLSHMLTCALGKNFIAKRKFPLMVNMKSKNLRTEFYNALAKATVYVSGKGSVSNCQIGLLEQTTEQLGANVQAIIDGIPTSAPGGWRNISSLHLRMPKSTSIPIYMSFESPNDIKTPNLIAKKGLPIIDELNTLTRSNIKIFPSGEVQLIKKEKAEDNIENELTALEIGLLNQKKKSPTNTPKKIKKMSSFIQEKKSLANNKNNKQNSFMGEKKSPNDKNNLKRAKKFTRGKRGAGAKKSLPEKKENVTVASPIIKVAAPVIKAEVITKSPKKVKSTVKMNVTPTSAKSILKAAKSPLRSTVKLDIQTTTPQNKPIKRKLVSSSKWNTSKKAKH